MVTFGLPGSASTWVFNVVRAIFHECGVKAHSLSADDGLAVLDNLPLGTDLVILKAHSMDLRLLRLCEMADARLIISQRDYRDSLVSLIDRFGISYREAARDLARSVVTLTMLPERLRRLSLRYEDGFVESPETIAQIAWHLGVMLQADAMIAIWRAHTATAVRSAIADRFSQVPTQLRRHDETTQWHPDHIGDGLVGKWRKRLDPSESDAIAAALGPLSLKDREYPLSLRWKAALFSFDEEVAKHIDFALDGRERVLVYGPYLYLPVGVWQATLRADWDVPLKLDVFCPINGRGTLCEIELPVSSGFKKATVSFDHCDHFEPIEIRLSTFLGYRGTVRFESVDLLAH